MGDSAFFCIFGIQGFSGSVAGPQDCNLCAFFLPEPGALRAGPATLRGKWHSESGSERASESLVGDL